VGAGRLGSEHHAQLAAVATRRLLLRAPPLERRLHVAHHLVHVRRREESILHDAHARGARVEEATREQRVLPRCALPPRAAVHEEHERPVANAVTVKL